MRFSHLFDVYIIKYHLVFNNIGVYNSVGSDRKE